MRSCIAVLSIDTDAASTERPVEPSCARSMASGAASVRAHAAIKQKRVRSISQPPRVRDEAQRVHTNGVSTSPTLGTYHVTLCRPMFKSNKILTLIRIIEYKIGSDAGRDGQALGIVQDSVRAHALETARRRG